jgi:hypothetical protein
MTQDLTSPLEVEIAPGRFRYMTGDALSANAGEWIVVALLALLVVRIVRELWK